MKVAILTNFNSFNPGYSLTGIVQDQARMLLRHGHEPHLFCGEKYDHKYDAEFPAGVVIRPEVPFPKQIDYRKRNEVTQEHEAVAEAFGDKLVSLLADFDMGWTHDWVFTGWFLPYAIAVQRASPRLPRVRWLHWIHSIPCTGYDWWDMKLYSRRHKLVSPTETERRRVAEQYRGEISDVRVIPHIKDPRVWYRFSQDSWDFIDDYPGCIQADVFQIYPASADRLTAKNVDKVIRIFGFMKKKLNRNVCFICADQWATGRQRREDEQTLIDLARAVGLEESEFAFTSRWRPDEKGRGKYATGIPSRMVAELGLLQNLFIFPTIQESFGLVGPEAALGGAYVVTNRSLTNQLDVFDNIPNSYDFGSYHHTFNPESWDRYLEAVAYRILGRMHDNEAVWCKRHMIQKLNMDAVYENAYALVMAESELWMEEK